MLIDQRKLKFLVLESCHKCIMIYFKTFSFSKLARISQSQQQSPPVSGYDLPTCKVWSWLIKGNSSYRKKKLMFDALPPDHWHPQSNHLVKTRFITAHFKHTWVSIQTTVTLTMFWHKNLQQKSEDAQQSHKQDKINTLNVQTVKVN